MYGMMAGRSSFEFEVTRSEYTGSGSLAAGITAPIVPGIMPVTNPAGLQRMAAMCGAAVPDWLMHLFDGTEDDAEIRRMVTADGGGGAGAGAAGEREWTSSTSIR